jgi:hypothetical protein
MPTVANNFTTVVHREPYAAISPSRAQLSQKGKVVLVTGSSGGIGFAIARAFGKASAAKVILTGRHQGPLDTAVATLSKESPQTTFIARLNDASDIASVEDLWKQFDAEGLVVDVLVLNVARVQPTHGSILEIGYKEVLADLATNANSIAAFVDFFYHQSKRDTSKKLVCILARPRYLRTVYRVIMTDRLLLHQVLGEHIDRSHSQFRDYSWNPKLLSVQERRNNFGPADRQICIAR